MPSPGKYISDNVKAQPRNGDPAGGRHAGRDASGDTVTPFAGEVEVDESGFGGTRKGKRGRGAAGKTPVFGLLKRGGKVYAKVIPNVRRQTLMDMAAPITRST